MGNGVASIPLRLNVLLDALSAEKAFTKVLICFENVSVTSFLFYLVDWNMAQNLSLICLELRKAGDHIQTKLYFSAEISVVFWIFPSENVSGFVFLKQNNQNMERKGVKGLVTQRVY